MEKLTTLSIEFYDNDDLKSLKISASNNLWIEIIEPNMPETITTSINLNRSDTLKLIDFLNYVIKNK